MDYTRRNFLKNTAKAITFLGLPVYSPKDALCAPSQLNIGIIASVTGPFAGLGREGLRGAQMAVQEINSSGGILGTRTHINIMDDQGQIHRGYQAFQMLAKAYNTIALIGATSFSYDKTLSELAEHYKLPFFVINPFRRTWYRKGLRYTFRVVPEASLMANQALGYLVAIAKQRGVPVKSIGVFRTKSGAWDEAIEKISTAAKHKNLSLSFDIPVPHNIDDIRSVVYKIKNIPSDLVFLLISRGPAIKTVVETMREVRFKTKAIVGFFSRLANAAYVAEHGNLFIDLMDANYWANPRLHEIKFFQNNFYKRFGVYPSNSSYGTYTAVMILRHAIERSGSFEKLSFTSYMRKATFPRFLLAQRNGIKFDSQGRNINAETILLQVSNPRPKAVYPKRYSAKEPLFPISTA